MSNRGERGSLLIEGAYGIFLLVASVLLTLEIARRSLISLSLNHAAFIAARYRALGESQFSAQSEVEKILSPYGSPRWRVEYREAYVARAADLARLQLGEQGGGMVGLVYRYPQFLNQTSSTGDVKSRQEVSARCLFPF